MCGHYINVDNDDVECGHYVNVDNRCALLRYTRVFYIWSPLTQGFTQQHIADVCKTQMSAHNDVEC